MTELAHDLREGGLPAEAYQLFELHLLQVATGEAALGAYQENLKTRIHESIELSGRTLEDVARHCQERVEPAIRNGLAAVNEAAYQALNGNRLEPADHEAMHRLLGRATFRGLLAEIYFMQTFRDELPADITRFLDDYPNFSFLEIQQDNQQLDSGSGLSLTAGSEESQAAPGLAEELTAHEPTTSDLEVPEPADDTGKEQGVVAAPEDEEEITLSPADILNLDPRKSALLDTVRVVSGGVDLGPLKPEEVYALAVLCVNKGEWFKQADYNKTNLLEAIVRLRNLSDTKSTLSNAIRRLVEVSINRSWPVKVIHNGEWSRNSRYRLEGSIESVSFFVDSETYSLSEAQDAKEALDTEGDSAISQLSPELAEKYSSIFGEEPEAADLFNLLLAAGEQGLPREEVKDFYTNLADFLRKLRLWGSAAKGDFTVHAAATSSRIKISPKQ